ncbi:hypothetical protein K8R61_02400 [bacterium]|nr:hypothetical protein [bacterium]
MEKAQKREKKIECASEKFWTGLADLFLIPIFVSEKGWKEGIGKRFGYLIGLVVILLFLMFFLNGFKESSLFKEFLSVGSFWLFLRYAKKASRGKKIWYLFLWSIYFICVIYLDDFIVQFTIAMLIVIGCYCLIFWIEEYTWKNIYPKWAIIISICAIIFFLADGVHNIFKDNKYYADRQTISANSLKMQKESITELKSKFVSRDVPQGAKMKLPDDIAGRDNPSFPIKNLAKSFFANHQPSFFDRIKKIVDDFSMAIYLTIVLIPVSLVSTKEKLGETIEKIKSSKKEKDGKKRDKKEQGESGISYAQTFFMERIWDLLKEVLSIWKRKK